MPESMVSQISSAVTVGSLASAAWVSALVLPSMRFGEAWSNLLAFFLPQLALLGLHWVLPERPQAAVFAGLAFALLAVTALFSAYVGVQPAENFMVAYLFWVALAGASAASLVLRRPLAKLSPMPASVVVFVASLAGAAISMGAFL